MASVYTYWTTNPTMLVCTLLCSIAFLFIIRLSRRPKAAYCPLLPPSPPRLPLLGNFHQLTAIPHKGLHALSQKLGPLFLMHFGSVPFAVISTGKLAREVTNTHDYIFCERSSTKSSRMLFDGIDDILIAPENKFWRLTKKLCVVELLSAKRVKSFQYIREEEAARLVRIIRSSCDGNNRPEVDLSSSFLELASNILSRAVLGVKSTTDNSDDARFAEKGKLAIQGVHTLSELLSFEDFIPCLAWMDHLTGTNKRLKTTCKAMHEFLDEVITEREIQCRNGYVNDKKSLVDIILELQQKKMIDIDLTRNNIRSILLDMFIAGIATSSATMEWAMTHLVKNPRVMKKVQNEIREIIGKKRDINEDDIAQMDYLKCVIKETLRLHGPTMTGRQPTTDVTIGGFKIPAMATTLINMYTIHRDPVAWERPLEFLPERFQNASYNFKGLDGAYFPFGLGKRMCPGTNFAMSEIEYSLASVLYWFDWELPENMKADDLDMRGTGSVTSHRVIPLRLVPKICMPVHASGLII